MILDFRLAQQSRCTKNAVISEFGFFAVNCRKIRQFDVEKSKIMNKENQIKIRTKQIGLEVIKLVDELPRKMSAWMISKQIVRCSTSVGSNYRAACRAKSDADFLNKLRIVEEETDETSYWWEILEEAYLVEPFRIEKLKREVNEITAIIVASQKTVQNKIHLKKGN